MSGKIWNLDQLSFPNVAGQGTREILCPELNQVCPSLEQGRPSIADEEAAPGFASALLTVEIFTFILFASHSMDG